MWFSVSVPFYLRTLVLFRDTHKGYNEGGELASMVLSEGSNGKDLILSFLI